MSMTEAELDEYEEMANELEEGHHAAAVRLLVQEIHYINRKYDMLRTETLKLRRMVTSVQGIVNS